MLATFDEDINLHTASTPGSMIEAMGLATWSEGRIQQRWGGGETGVVTLGWNQDQPARYTIRLLGDAQIDPDGELIFSLADALNDPPMKGKNQGAPATGAQAMRQPIDLTVALLDAAGQEARLPLSTRMPVQPQIVVDVWKAPLFNARVKSEAVLQSYAFALSEFAAANPAFDPAQIRAVGFIFNRTPIGSVLLDGVGFRAQSDPIVESNR